MTNCRVTICRTTEVNKVQSDNQADLNLGMRKNKLEDNQDMPALTNAHLSSVIKA